MVLTAATTTSSASAIVPAPMTRYDRALPVNSMTEKRYSDRRLRPWPPTYNYGIPGGGGGGPGGGSAGSASGSAMLAMTTGGGGGGGGGKSRWMSAGLSDIGASLGGLRGSSAGSIYGGSVGGGVPQPRYLYAPPGGALKRQNSDFFLNVKSAASLAGSVYDYNNNASSNNHSNGSTGGNYVVNNIAARKVKNIAGMTAIVDSDSNMEVVRRMRRHSTTQQNNYLQQRLQKQQQQQLYQHHQQQHHHQPQQQQHHHPHQHQPQQQQQFFNVSASTRSRSKSMEDFGSSGFIIENSYKYRTKNVLTASTTTTTTTAGSPHGHLKSSQHQHQQLNNSSVHSNNLSLAGGGGGGGGGSGGGGSRVVSPNQSTSSAPHANGGGGGKRTLRHHNNFGNNLNGGHSYDNSNQQHQQQHQHHQHLTHGKKLLSLKNHRSVDNLLDNVDINYSQYYQQSDQNRPRFVAVTTLEDVQAVRCAEFHPNGRIYAVGSNSKTFRICEYPSLSEIREDHSTYQPTVLFKRTKHHKGSIYCMAWSPAGDLIATGSNDKTVKLMRFNESQKQLEGQEMELTMHDGTVRDLCFLEDSSNKSSLLISGGAGDCKIYVTDCETSTPFQALSGHGGHVLSLYNWGGVMFVSGSQDKTVRFWDLRTRGCVNMVTPATSPGSRQGSPVAAVCVDPSGRLLVSGHEDSSCVLYDIRGNRPIQCFKPHSSDVRSIRFSPSAYYLLTAGYDNKLVLTDLQGDLTMPLPSVVVAQHTDKVISGRWHPVDFSFLSTSADKTATLWALPPI
ncbi:putative uncharacterized protein DDB_G0277255 isoform X6 [Anopheles gambiae]|uniref:putative uncharacterized protein DDB_G0277255 isoform X6 n=1 Tax=Anopheles gambiae TaxID=7165 RepID=UPI002AC8B701|nr:putative uncharacterized protein DDB_G0277255 isoform X6 [Anopheles gambiae]